jgi:hypothetical protein
MPLIATPLLTNILWFRMYYALCYGGGLPNFK